MMLSSVETTNFQILRQVDCAVAAAGWEPRSIAVVKAAKRIAAVRRVGFCFSSSNPDDITLFNRSHFERHGYELLKFESSHAGQVASFMRELLSAGASEILVDISSMTRAWYAAILDAVRAQEGGQPIRVHFTYFPGVYPRTHVTEAPNEVFAPLRGFSGLEPPRRPIALLLSLGFDLARADALIHRMEPKRVVAFMHEYGQRPGAGTDDEPEDSDEYEGDVPFQFPVGAFEIHKHLEVHDPGSAFFQLESMVRGLEEEYRIVGCSLGPKMFGLVMLLVAVVRPSLGVWRVSSGGHQPPSRVKAATRIPFVCTTTWEPG